MIPIIMMDSHARDSEKHGETLRASERESARAGAAPRPSEPRQLVASESNSERGGDAGGASERGRGGGGWEHLQ
jgi:hypothetical protein